ncbi:hypothetical protein ACFVTZ_03690 [Cellulosimicrobium cellulans]|uniref:hypothetical protein n=1 Tax=Cellulosimicrobium cellulans TaxID=1710 RepID=UPI0036E1E45E
MIEVELDIFSGRPNPRWILTPQQEDNLLARIEGEAVTLGSVDTVEEKLGYRGFILRPDGATARTLGRTLPNEFRVRSALFDEQEANTLAESWLLDTADFSQASEEVWGYVEDGIAEPVEPKLVVTSKVPSAAAVAAACTIHKTSTTNLVSWNTQPYQGVNNCYNYASNYRNGTRFAQPGVRGGQVFTALTVSSLRAAALRDGYATSCVGGTHIYVYFCIWPGVDYHWYRRTADSGTATRWCHKPGSTKATNKDNSGNWIVSPGSANRGKYTTAGGYLWGPGSSRPVS